MVTQIRRKQKRDLTNAQFLAALDREGFGRPEFLGYCDLRRDQLAYLRQQRRRLGGAS